MTSPFPPAWSRADDLAVVENPERAAILDLSRLADPPVVLEGTAAAIWSLVGSHTPEGDIVSALAEAYEIEPEVIAPQVATFLGELEQAHLVLRRDSLPADDDPGVPSESEHP